MTFDIAIPAQAGIQQLNNFRAAEPGFDLVCYAGTLELLDSRLRGNGVHMIGRSYG